MTSCAFYLLLTSGHWSLYNLRMATATAAQKSTQADRQRQVWADSALVVVTLVWGTTFVLVKDIVQQVSPMVYLTARFALAALALALAAVLSGRLKGLSLREMRWGVLIGLALWAGYALQTLGLQYTSASNAGFITGLSVVLVPVMAVFLLKQVPGVWAILGVVLATLGLAMLSLRLDEGLRVNWGDALVLGCAFAFALQIVLVARVAAWADPLRLTLVQVLTVGLLNGLSALLFEQPVVGIKPEIWVGIIFLGVVVTAATIVIQVGVQRFTNATHTALLFTLEPVFAAAFGFWLQGDRLGPIALAGAVLILGGMVIAELGPHLRPEWERAA